jgi:hypothetical protein
MNVNRFVIAAFALVLGVTGTGTTKAHAMPLASAGGDGQYGASLAGRTETGVHGMHRQGSYRTFKDRDSALELSGRRRTLRITAGGTRPTGMSTSIRIFHGSSATRTGMDSDGAMSGARLT